MDGVEILGDKNVARHKFPFSFIFTAFPCYARGQKLQLKISSVENNFQST